MGPAKYTGEFGEAQLRHLLRRTLVGLRKVDFISFKDLSLTEVIDKLFEPAGLPDPPVNNYSIRVEDQQVEPGNSWVEEPAEWQVDPDNSDLVDARNESVSIWMLKHMLTGGSHLHYKLILFWHNHFANQFGFVGTGKIAYLRMKNIWNFAYGNFKNIMREITLDPCMLIFLNGTENIKVAPDENYARELQELFCIGKGPKAKFTEADVQEAARVLTGWGVDWDTVIQAGETKSRFYDFQHETRDKKFSSFYGNKVIKGRTGEDGADELDELIDMVVEHPETARFICRKLHRFFISQEITPEAETNFIEPLAEYFIEQDYEMIPLLKAMFSSAYFFAERHCGAMIKSPPDVLGGFVKNCEITYISDQQDLDEEYWTYLMFYFNMADMGYLFGDPPSVSGWPAYYQIPTFDKLWITTFTLISRIILSDSFINEGFWTPQKRIPWDVIAYTQQLDDPFDPDLLIEELCLTHLAVPIADERKAELKSILLTGQLTNSYWTNAWADYQNNPSDPIARETVEMRLKFFYTSFFQMPEYQLM